MIGPIGDYDDNMTRCIIMIQVSIDYQGVPQIASRGWGRQVTLWILWGGPDPPRAVLRYCGGGLDAPENVLRYYGGVWTPKG